MSRAARTAGNKHRVPPKKRKANKSGTNTKERVAAEMKRADKRNQSPLLSRSHATIVSASRRHAASNPIPGQGLPPTTKAHNTSIAASEDPMLLCRDPLFFLLPLQQPAFKEASSNPVTYINPLPSLLFFGPHGLRANSASGNNGQRNRGLL